jgi:hypothetical protein
MTQRFLTMSPNNYPREIIDNTAAGVKLLIPPRFPTMAPNIYPREILDISVGLHFAATSSEAAGEAAALVRIGDG